LVVAVPDSIRIRAQVKNGGTEIHVLMPHPMETGFRKDEAGGFIPAHYITDVEIVVAGRTVLKATLSRAVSEDPLLFFRIAGGHTDDPIRVSWVDSWGERRVDETVITAAV
jgi:sulfur-oxidizing protein SoxZ